MTTKKNVSTFYLRQCRMRSGYFILQNLLKIKLEVVVSAQNHRERLHWIQRKFMIQITCDINI